MKIRNIQIILLSLVALFCFSACSLEGDATAAGDLAGMWKCVYIEKGAQKRRTEKIKKVFWSFQGKLLLLEDKTGVHSWILYHFNKKR